MNEGPLPITSSSESAVHNRSSGISKNWVFRRPRFRSQVTAKSARSAGSMVNLAGSRTDARILWCSEQAGECHRDD